MYKLFIDSSLIRKQKWHIRSEGEFSMDMLYVLKGIWDMQDSYKERKM